MGRGCALVLPAFAIAAVVGYLTGWIAFVTAPLPDNSMEGTSGIQTMFFDAPALALAAGGAAAVFVGARAVLRGRLSGANRVGVGLVLAVPAFLAIYYGLFAGHQLLLAHLLVPAPADPFLVSRTIAPIAAGVAAAALMLWMLLRPRGG
jgi:hypothetical protein